MHTTHISLIEQLQCGDELAWQKLNQLYRPLFIKWLRRYHLQSSDIEDITQDLLQVVSQRIGDFDHNGRDGAFRSWLRTVIGFRANNYLTRKNKQPVGTGESGFQQTLEQLSDPHSDASRQFDQDHACHVVGWLLSQMGKSFGEVSLTAFRHLTQ